MILIDYISLTIAAFGGAVIVWAILVTAVRVVRFNACSLSGGTTCCRGEAIRHKLGMCLLLGLDFMIAADVINREFADLDA